MKIRFASYFTLLFFLTATSSLFAQTFSNPAAITINDNTTATPYPSNIAVSLLGPTVTNVTVTLHLMTHNFPDDVGFLLVGPTGVAVRLMTDAGGGGPGFSLTDVTFSFDDAAATPVPDEGPIVGGTSYQPTEGIVNLLSGAHDANFPGPAPAGPYSLLLSDFNGTNPNGTWSLYVDDDTAIDGGDIEEGWSISITAVPEPSTWMLVTLGVVGSAALTYLRRRNRAD